MAGPLIRRNSTAPAAAAANKRFVYRARTAEEIRERQKQQGGARDGIFASDVQFYSSKQGDNDIRIMPPTWGEARHYGMEIHVHYGVGADENAYLCLDKMKGEKCPICEERERAAAAGEQNYADSLKPSKRVAIYLIDRKEEGKGPLVWNMPWTVDRDISNLCIDGKTGEIYAVDNPDEGFDVQFKREGERDRTKYTGIQIARRPSPLSDNGGTMDKWLQHIIDQPLDSRLTFYDYDHIKAAFNPGGDETSLQERAASNPRAQERAERADAKARKAGEAPAPRAEAPAPRARLEKKAEAPAAAPATAAAGAPTWDQLTKMNVEELGSVGNEFKIDFPDEGFTEEGADGLDGLRKFLADKLGVKQAAAPAPTPAAKGGDWRSRLAGNK